MDYEQLRQRQSLPLEAKIRLSERAIVDWYEHFSGNVYVSFSGGRDSTVLLHLVRSIYPDVGAVFFNTGIEYPETIKLIRETDNVTWIAPEKKFESILREYGYPVVSKDVAQKVYEVRNTRSDKLRSRRLGDNPSGRLPYKWRFLLDAPFPISSWCCAILKKRPAKKFEKVQGLVPFLGMRAIDSSQRLISILKYGCNAFGAARKASNPLAPWLEGDIEEYVKKYALRISEVYQQGYRSSGCALCAFGAHQETCPNRFQLLRSTHPKLHSYCIEHLGMGKVLDYIGIPY